MVARIDAERDPAQPLASALRVWALADKRKEAVLF
jgi:predicted DNA-binding ribbon-helix-helix protein